MGNVSASSTMKEKIVNDVLGDIMTILSVNCLVIWPSMPLFLINKHTKIGEKYQTKIQMRHFD